MILIGVTGCWSRLTVIGMYVIALIKTVRVLMNTTWF